MVKKAIQHLIGTYMELIYFNNIGNVMSTNVLNIILRDHNKKVLISKKYYLAICTNANGPFCDVIAKPIVRPQPNSPRKKTWTKVITKP